MKAKPRKTHRKEAAEAPTIRAKGLVAALGSARDCEAEEKLCRDLSYLAWVHREGGDPNLPAMAPEEKEELEQGRLSIALSLADRVLAEDAEFFERMAKLIYSKRARGGAPSNLLGWQITHTLLVFAKGVRVEEGRGRRLKQRRFFPDPKGAQSITSPMLCELMEQLFPESIFDAGNVRKEARGLGISLPISCAKLRAESQKWVAEVIPAKE